MANTSVLIILPLLRIASATGQFGVGAIGAPTACVGSDVAADGC